MLIIYLCHLVAGEQALNTMPANPITVTRCRQAPRCIQAAILYWCALITSVILMRLLMLMQFQHCCRWDAVRRSYQQTRSSLYVLITRGGRRLMTRTQVTRRRPICFSALHRIHFSCCEKVITLFSYDHKTDSMRVLATNVSIRCGFSLEYCVEYCWDASISTPFSKFKRSRTLPVGTVFRIRPHKNDLSLPWTCVWYYVQWLLPLWLMYDMFWRCFCFLSFAILIFE